MPDRLVVIQVTDLEDIVRAAVGVAMNDALADLGANRPWLTREAMADALGGVSVEEVSRRARRGEIETVGTGKARRYRVKE